MKKDMKKLMKDVLLNKIKDLYYKTKADVLDSKTLYQGKFIRLNEETYKLPNGRIITKERIIKNNNKEAVIIITETVNNTFLLVSQNRINGVTLEFPSGYIEEDENVFDAGLRELNEETGYTADDIVFIDSYYSTPGIDSAKVSIVLVKNATKTNEQHLDNDEFINYDEFTFDELQELFNNNYITGVGNKLAYFYLLEIIRKNEVQKLKKLTNSQ